MRIDFTIPLPLVEFIVHFIAAMFYFAAGACRRSFGVETPLFVLLGIILTLMGASL